jgi:undecaprenyl-diphosphatase
MLNEIILAIVQAATEFLPVSSSGHLALVSKLISQQPSLFFFTMLHLASLIAILIFTRKEIFELLKFNENGRRTWIYVIIATIPAALVGFFLKDYIESSLNSLLFLGIAFIFTGLILILTRGFGDRVRLSKANSFIIGLFQALAVFPGVSRSGMTISSGLFFGLSRERAAKFSFLLAIPLILGAAVLEIGEFYFSMSLLISFIICTILSLIFLNVLMKILNKGYFWIFGFYCLFIGILSIIFWFF